MKKKSTQRPSRRRPRRVFWVDLPVLEESAGAWSNVADFTTRRAARRFLLNTWHIDRETADRYFITEGCP